MYVLLILLPCPLLPCCTVWECDHVKAKWIKQKIKNLLQLRQKAKRTVQAGKEEERCPHADQRLPVQEVACFPDRGKGEAGTWKHRTRSKTGERAEVKGGKERTERT